MAVEVRYHVIRDGKEVGMYATKKEADEHDKMLDIAQNLFAFIQKAKTLEMEEESLEELSIYLAKNRDRALTILRGIKPRKPPQKPVADAKKETSKPTKPKQKPKKKPKAA